MATLNIKEVDLDTPIYRIMRFDHVVSMFTKGTNALVPPKKWEDPFENYLLKSKAEMPGGELVDFAFHDDFYGQCWSLHKASDAMWRIYSADKRGVRVKTTIRKLYQSLVAHLGGHETPHAHIGKVEYLKRDALLKRCDEGVELFSDGVSITSTLLVKRWAFKHEREVRLLYMWPHTHAKKPDLFIYKIDPHSFVEQLMVDPRLTPEEGNNYKTCLRACTGFKGDIKRSLMYATPKGFVTKIFSGP